ncbi:PAS domain-containing protein [Fodinibius halophilus]|uniref:PAS domain S-box protein n=1 Tax=Fodinibius halophilus TaxID=1736908 RepID=A0A6M1TET6_9BACT|nr:PAS domain S-box protein [Fodinibius halophilus]NGP88692.1 PAS domain S-box protein [Fodinibius halophilus]
MWSDKLNKLKKWCKDEESFEKVKDVVEDFIEERNEKTKRLRLLESAIRSDYDSILITELSLEAPGPKIVYVNDGFCKMTGYSKEEVIGQTPRILQGPKTDRTVLNRLKNRLKEGRSFFGQTINYKKDGSEFVNQWDIHPLKDKEGNITHWVSYQHDITERKRAEEQLLDQKLEFDSLRKQSKRTVVDVDIQGNIVMANKSFRELVGYSKDELKRVKAWDLFPEKYMHMLSGWFERSDAEIGSDGEEFKSILKHKSGVPIQVKANAQILDLKDQRLIRVEFQNISLKKRVMDALKKRNLNYVRMVEKASEFTYEVAFEGNKPVFQSFSNDFSKVTGLSKDSVVGEWTAEKFVHEDDIETYWSHLKKVQKGKSSTCEYRLLSKDGNYIEVLDYCKPQWDDQKKTVCSIRCAVSLDEAYKKTEA